MKTLELRKLIYAVLTLIGDISLQGTRMRGTIMHLLDDPASAKFIVGEARNTVTKIVEKFTQLDHALYDLQASLYACDHVNHIKNDTYYSCADCGDVWNGLKWDEPGRMSDEALS